MLRKLLDLLAGDDGTLRDPAALSTQRLRDIAAAQGIAPATGIRASRIIGRSFQEFALRSLALRENSSIYKGPAAPRIIPDAVTAQSAVTLGGSVPAWYPESTFVEVKAVNGTLDLWYRRGQMHGYIAAAAASPAGRGRAPHTPPAKIIFIMTGDTVIGADVLAEATKNRVAIWQGVVFEDRDVSPTEPARLGLGPIVPMNPEVYPGVVFPDVPAVLSGSLLPPTGTSAPYDPDPADVD